MVRVALSHFREVKMGERVRWGESHRRKTVPAVLALVTVSKESQFKYNGHQRSSAADVVCLLNHPFIEGLLIQYPQVRPCFGLVFWVFFCRCWVFRVFFKLPCQCGPCVQYRSFLPSASCSFFPSSVSHALQLGRHNRDFKRFGAGIYTGCSTTRHKPLQETKTVLK